MPTKPNLYGEGGTSDDELRGNGRSAKIDRQKMGERKGPEDPIVARYWREVERYDRSVKDWHTDADQISDIYMAETTDEQNSKRRFPLFWANVEVMKPAVYAKLPVITCGRRFKDKDPIGKVCASIMERAANTTLDLYHVHEVFKSVRDDRLIIGRGTGWVRYEADIDQYDDPDGAKDDAGEIVKREKVRHEKVCVDYVAPKDFGHNTAPAWYQDVWLVWRRVYKTRDEVSERFGEDVAKRLNYDSKAPGGKSDNEPASSAQKLEPEDCAQIYEFWDKRKGTVSWGVKGEREFLETGKPPLNFRDFFPCPRPCYATLNNRKLVPKPDYAYYRTQAKEINDLTEKIGILTEWLQVKGFIPAGPSSVADPIEEALRDKSNSELFVQVESYSEWTEKGGAAKLIDWLPIEAVVKALTAAIQARNQLIQDVFQITGISDILRGQTDPNETLGAQELKAQTGTRRLRNVKDEHARFCCDTGKLVAEVIAEKFSPQSLAAISGYTYVPQQAPVLPGMPTSAPMPGAPASPPMPGMQPPMMGHNGGPAMSEQEEADNDASMVFDDRHIQLLRDDQMRNFKIDVETDSTVQADEQAEKEGRVQFVEVIGNYLLQASQLLAVPACAPLAPAICETILFLIRGFHAGQSLEAGFESGFAKVRQTLQQAQQMAAQQPSPEIAKVQAEAQLKEKELAAEQQATAAKIQGDQQIAMVNAQNDRQTAAQDAAIKMKEINTKAMIEQTALQAKTQLEIRKQNLDHKAQREKATMDNQATREKTTLDNQAKHAQIRATASAQAQDRIAKAMRERKSSSSARH